MKMETLRNDRLIIVVSNIQYISNLKCLESYGSEDKL